MNELDSEVMASQLEQRGLVEADNENDADLIIFNTCSIRDLAERKLFGKLGVLSRKKRKKIIGIAGCTVMAKKEKILDKFENVSFIIGTNNLTDLNNILDEIEEKNIRLAKTDITYEKKLETYFAKRKNNIKASVSITRGCNNFCSFCVVPYTRGREYSRSFDTIIDESKFLVDQGIKEIMLLGQNVDSYGTDNPQMNKYFHDLLYEINKINGLERIRFMTSHPKDITIDLMHAIKDCEKVCKFVHFPLQAGSNRVLKEMRRGYTYEEYLGKVNKLRELVPNVAIGTDIIVGFPNESDEDFLKTYKAFEEINFDLAFIYEYSPRKNTLAYKLYEDNVSTTLKDQRLKKLMAIYNKILKEKLNKLVNTTQEILVERFNKDNTFLKGRTQRNEKVIFKGDKSHISTIQKIKIQSTNHQTLIGEVL
jgi:tRNA-2-methylthio-N6-dimethylallyladenosine synthase